MEDVDQGGFFDGHTISQDDAMAELESEGQRIRDKMAERRAFLEIQARSDELKASLCNKIQEEKAKVPGLRERINALETTDPELFKFIRKLEYIQDGIWCPTCNKQKNIGVPRSRQGGDGATQPGAEAPNVEVALKEFIDSAEKKITNLAGKFMNVLQEAEEYRQKLADATARAQAIEDEFIKFKNRVMSGANAANSVGADSADGSPVLKPKSFVENRPAPAPAPAQVPAWMKERVDTRPNFDLADIGARLESTIDAELDKKYASDANTTGLTSDDLLN
jgi:predicted  nucleic acid-binding Zn-ribbon protein